MTEPKWLFRKPILDSMSDSIRDSQVRVYLEDFIQSECARNRKEGAIEALGMCKENVEMFPMLSSSVKEDLKFDTLKFIDAEIRRLRE